MIENSVCSPIDVHQIAVRSERHSEQASEQTSKQDTLSRSLKLGEES